MSVISILLVSSQAASAQDDSTTTIPEPESPAETATPSGPEAAGFTLTFDAALVETALSDTWSSSGAGFSGQASFSFPLLDSIGKGRFPIRPLANLGIHRNVASLSGSNYQAYDELGVLHDVLKTSDVQLRYGGLLAGVLLRVAHPGGFLDFGGGIRTHGDGSLIYYDNDTTTGDECEMDVSGAVNVYSSLDSSWYAHGRYGLFISPGAMFQDYTGLYVGADVRASPMPTFSADSGYSRLIQEDGSSAPLPSGSQTLTNISLSMGLAF